MRMIYHVVANPARGRTLTEVYSTDSLAKEGFIHCSNHDQVIRVANQFYGQEQALLILCINVDRLTSPVRDEDGGTGELFPHVYGPIDRVAIVEERALRRDKDGLWEWKPK